MGAGRIVGRHGSPSLRQAAGLQGEMKVESAASRKRVRGGCAVLGKQRGCREVGKRGGKGWSKGKSKGASV